MEKLLDTVGTVEAAMTQLDRVHAFYEPFNFRFPQDDKPFDPRPSHMIPKAEWNVTPPNRWQGMVHRFRETEDLPGTLLTTELGLLLGHMGSLFHQVKDKEQALDILATFLHNLTAVRDAMKHILQGRATPPTIKKDAQVKWYDLQTKTTQMAASVLNAHGDTAASKVILDYKIALLKLRGRVATLPNSGVPYEAVACYQYTQGPSEKKAGCETYTLLDAKAFGIPKVQSEVARDMVKLLCIRELEQDQTRYLKTEVRFDPS